MDLRAQDEADGQAQAFRQRAEQRFFQLGPHHKQTRLRLDELALEFAEPGRLQAISGPDKIHAFAQRPDGDVLERHLGRDRARVPRVVMKISREQHGFSPFAFRKKAQETCPITAETHRQNYFLEPF
jgi:hypothetical protein